MRLSESLPFMTLSYVKNTAFDFVFKQCSTLERNIADLQRHSFFVYSTVSKKWFTLNTALCENFRTFLGYCAQKSGPKGTQHCERSTAGSFK